MLTDDDAPTFTDSVDLSIIDQRRSQLHNRRPLSSTMRESADWEAAGEYEELVETESLLNETVMAHDARYPDLKNQTVIAQEHLRFSETYQNVDFVADIVIAQGEMENFTGQIALYKERLARLRKLEELKREAMLNPGRRHEVEREMSKLKHDLNETIKSDTAQFDGIKIEYIQITHFVEPCDAIVDSCQIIAGAFHHVVNVEHLVKEERAKLFEEKRNQTQHSSTDSQTDLKQFDLKPKVKCQDQTQQIKPDQSNKLIGTKKLACHHEETQTKRQRYTEESCQTVRVRLETTAAQTLDSGIDTDSDDSDVPKEFKNIKKAAIAKKVIEQKDTIKAKDDQIKMQQDQIKEMAAENGDKDALIKTKQVYIDKLQNRVSELRDELEKPKKSSPIIVDKMTKLEDENERLIASIEKLTKQLDETPNVITHGQQHSVNTAKAPMVKETTKESEIGETLVENAQLTEANKCLKETTDNLIDENEQLKDSNDQLNKTLGDTLKEVTVLKKLSDKRNSIKMESKKIGADLKPTVEANKQRVASSQTKPSKKVAKSNQTKPQTPTRTVNRNVQTIWTSDRIERVKEELKKVKDQLKTDDLAKLRDEMRKDHSGGNQEQPVSPTRQTMKSTTREAKIEEKPLRTPSVMSTDAELDELDDVFEDKKISPPDELDEQVYVLKKENEKLQLDLERIQSTNEDIVDDVQNQLKKAIRRISELEDDNQELEEQNEELVKQTKDETDGPIDEDTGRPVTKAVLLDEVNDLRQINDDLNEEIRVQDQQIVKLESDLQRQHDADSSDDSDVLGGDKKTILRNKVQDLTDEKQNLTASNERLEDELVETRSKLKNEQRNNEMNEKHIMSQQDDIEDLAECNQNLEKELQRKNKELEDELLHKVPIQTETLLQSSPVEQKISNLAAECEQLQEEATQNEVTISRMAPLIDELEEKNKSLSDENDRLKNAIVEKSNQIMQQQMELDETTMSMKRLEDTLKNQENLKEGALAEVGKLQQNKRLSEDEINEILVENAQLAESNKVLKETGDEILDQNEKYKEQVQSIDEQLKTLQNENSTLNKKLAEGENKNEKTALEQVAKVKALDEVKKLKNENDKLSKEKTAIESEKKKLEKTVAENDKGTEKTALEKAAKLKALSEVKDLTNEKDKLVKENTEMKTIIKEFECEKKDLEEKLIDMNEKPSIVSQAPQTVQSSKTTLLQNEAERLIEELEKTKAGYSQLNAECDQLEDDLENERALKDGVLNQLNKSQQDNENLQNEFDDYMEQNELMGQDLEGQFHKIKQLEKENNELADLNDTLQNQNEFNHDMVQQARQRIRQLCAAAKKKEKMSKSEPNLVSVGSEPDVSQDKLKSSDTLDSGIFEDVIGDVLDLTQHHEELSQKMRHYDALLQENDQLKAEYAQLLNEFGCVKKTNKQLQSELNEIDKAFEESTVDDASEVSAGPAAKIVLLKKVNDELSQSLNQSRREDAESSDKITLLLQNENDRLIEENGGLKDALETSMKIDDYKSQPDSLEKRMSDLVVENNDLAVENSQLNEEIEKLKQEPYEETIGNQKGLKEGAIAQITRLEIENQELNQKLQQAEKSAPEHQKRIQDGIMSELKRKEAEVFSLQNENLKLSEKIAKAKQHAEEQTNLKNGALAEIARSDQKRLDEMTQNVREETEKVKLLDSTANDLLQNENKLVEIGNNLSQAHQPADLARKLEQFEADLAQKEELINDLAEKQEKAEYKELKQEKQIKSLINENHTLKSDLEYLTTQYEGLLQRNTELKRKVAYLRNEMELVNTSHLRNMDRLMQAETKKLRKRRDSDPELLKLANQRTHDGVVYRQLKNNDEIQTDQSKLGVQNKAKEDVFSRIEALKADISDLKSKLYNYEDENKSLHNSHAAAEEKCDQLERHLNRAADAAEQMNKSLSSSTMSMERIHDISENDEALIKLKAELAEMKRQKNKYVQNLSVITKKHEALCCELGKTRDKLADAQEKIMKYENQTLTDMSLGRQDSKNIERLKRKIDNQEKLLAEKDHMIETSSNISSDKDIQSHMDQSQAEFEMYEEDIRELKSQIDDKNSEIMKLQRKNKALCEKYESKRSDMVDSEIEDHLRTLQESPPLMNEEEKAKLEMINELRFILEEPELESPRSLNASVPGERHESQSAPHRSSVSSTESDVARLQEALARKIAILDEVISQNKSAGLNGDLVQVNEHLVELHHENQQLKADIDKRESTLKNLIYRYDQSERKVRQFIKMTLRTIMERQQRLQETQMDDSHLSEVFHL